MHVDETSHACHANLAVLYGLRQDPRAGEHIAHALRLDPDNASYVQAARVCVFPVVLRVCQGL